MPSWLYWLVAAAALAGAELLSLNLVLIMIAGGAVAGAAVAALGAPALVQAVVFALIAIVLLVGVRPLAQRHLQQAPATRTGAAALEGAPALVLEPVDAHRGQVKIGGEIWTARAYDPTQTIEAGQHAQVMEIRGATALVWRQP